MAGNIQADNNGDILVEFDYNNIIVVDPNKTIDAFGKIQERLVDHENLVMYANLEAEILPRTKLAVGAAPNDRIRTISVAKINFLKPSKQTYFGTGYYDELTGENSTKFKGENQMKLSALTLNTIKARDLIGTANQHFAAAQDILDLVQWISPVGDLYIERRSVIDDIIASGSWR